jgi:hypothetical protein
VGQQGIAVLIRLSATAFITVLAGIVTYYPHQTWIPATISAAAALGIHVIPSVTQVKGSNTVNEQSGQVLMGLVPPSPETPEKAPDTPETVPDTTADTTWAEAPVHPLPSDSAMATASLALRQAASDLVKMAESFE